jgi:uncharacterized protein YdeI (YjbR/CyaY-like superfamily)
MRPRFFRSPLEFRAWLDRHHATAQELLVGFHKKGTGVPSMTWPESVDEALCVGWIDGVRHRLDERRYTIRFTPRRPASIWSVVNTRRMAVLTREGRMRPAGLEAFRGRDPNRTALYSFERDPAVMPATLLREFRANRRAWAYFEAAPPSYKRVATHWVVSAKKDETRLRRLATLIGCSARGERLS